MTRRGFWLSCMMRTTTGSVGRASPFFTAWWPPRPATVPPPRLLLGTAISRTRRLPRRRICSTPLSMLRGPCTRPAATCSSWGCLAFVHRQGFGLTWTSMWLCDFHQALGGGNRASRRTIATDKEEEGGNKTTEEHRRRDWAGLDPKGSSRGRVFATEID